MTVNTDKGAPLPEGGGENKKPVVLHEKVCLRCAHRWLPRAPGRPASCPECRSP